MDKLVEVFLPNTLAKTMGKTQERPHSQGEKHIFIAFQDMFLLQSDKPIFLC